MSSKPLWLKAVHRIERAVGGPVEKAVRTDVYFDLVTKTTRVTGKVKRKVGGASTRVLHGINLPAGSDMTGMREQLSRMERRLNRLTEEVTELDGAPPDRATSNTPPKRATSKGAPPKRASSKGARPKRPTSNGAPPKRATGKGARPNRSPVD